MLGFKSLTGRSKGSTIGRSTWKGSKRLKTAVIRAEPHSGGPSKKAKMRRKGWGKAK